MKSFEHITAESFEQASAQLKKGKAGGTVVMAGGTDLMNVLKQALLPEYPETVINLKEIPGSSGILDQGDYIEIGALTKLVDVVESPIIGEKVSGMAEAAHSIATPLVRNTGTVGGNVCQDVRCWYYRYPHEGGGRMVCARKGGEQCYAIQGESRYHSIFGGMKTGLTPCTVECPASTDIPAYMEKLRAGDYDAAAEIIMRANPMPMITSRICPHPCQNKCNQNHYGDQVNVHAVERKLGDYILENASNFILHRQMKPVRKLALSVPGPAA